jgi:hypothetical protein
VTLVQQRLIISQAGRPRRAESMGATLSLPHTRPIPTAMAHISMLAINVMTHLASPHAALYKFAHLASHGVKTQTLDLERLTEHKP